ncbi:MAG: endonuclease/exonuclease/phosphatase family protein [Dysgonamonadaceae bacterium]|jgi:endonuclease/exonuclease/phosphatase family metal-dependent hydrolase|nr:endonuclease/exonuclease/phosphatase family protein [Dysgonamonadaceae bacterium]
MNQICKKTFFLLFINMLLGLSSYAQENRTLTVATYNVRYDNKGDAMQGNAWQKRVPIIRSLILFHDFDIFGTQEGLINQLQDMQKGLPAYNYIGIGREDGNKKGEFSAIFYKKEKFELLDSGHFWLAKNTGKPVKGWDAAAIRICTWGSFRELKSGFRFLFFNLHMDHVGVEARKNSAKLVLDTIKVMAGTQPVILTGDFNVDQHNESYLLINNSGILKDAYELAEIRHATTGTFNAFHLNMKTDSRIDHIFLTKSFKVERYGILTDTYRSPKEIFQEDAKMSEAPPEISFREYEVRLPSDHFPVVVKVGY